MARGAAHEGRDSRRRGTKPDPVDYCNQKLTRMTAVELQKRDNYIRHEMGFGGPQNQHKWPERIGNDTMTSQPQQRQFSCLPIRCTYVDGVIKFNFACTLNVYKCGVEVEWTTGRDLHTV